MCRRLLTITLTILACIAILLLHAYVSLAAPQSENAASIEGYVWLDDNRNGLADAGESGQADALIVLATPAGDVIAHTRTTLDGHYSLDGLEPGDYVLYETDAAGTVSTTSNLVELCLSSGMVADASFGDVNSLTGCFHHAVGSVWNDANSDGLPDSGEEKLAQVVVQCWTLEGSLCGVTLTDDCGAFALRNLPPKPCHLVVQLPEGMLASSTPVHWGIDPSVCYPAEIQVGLCAASCASVNLQTPHMATGTQIEPAGDSQLSGTVYREEMLPEAGAVLAPIAGVTLTLADRSGSVLAERQTDEYGHYSFQDLSWGSYYMTQRPVAGTVARPSRYWGAAVTIGSDVRIDLVNRAIAGGHICTVNVPLVER